MAPWTTTTHDCFHHSLSGCQGELVNTPVQVLITDAAGTVLVEDAASTFTGSPTCITTLRLV